MPRRSRGRPPLDAIDRSVSLSVRLPLKQYDALCRRARLERRSVAEQVRGELLARESGHAARDDDER